jgi:hypothetical protein
VSIVRIKRKTGFLDSYTAEKEMRNDGLPKVSNVAASTVLCGVFIVFLLAAVPVKAQEDYWYNNNRVAWPAKTTATNTLEAQLETVFSEFGQECGISPYNGDKNKVSYIPKNIRDKTAVLRLKDPVVLVPYDSAKRLMSFLFAESDLGSIATNRRIDAAKFVIGGSDLDSAPVPRHALIHNSTINRVHEGV